MNISQLIQLIAVILAAAILGNWYLTEFRKIRAAGLPLYRAYFSLPGILIMLLIFFLPVLARYIRD